MDKIRCEVIQDMLPLYVEDMASEATKEMVEEHLKSCEKCRKQAEEMGKRIVLPRDTDAKLLGNFRRSLLKKRVVTIALSVVCVILLGVLTVIRLWAPRAISYEELKESITVEQEENGNVSVSVMDNARFSNMERGKGEDGKEEVYLCRYTTQWDRIFKQPERMSVYRFGEQPEMELGEYDGIPAERIYYTNEANGEAVCIYDADGLDRNGSGGLVILPRLTLNYYMMLSGILAVIGGICCIAVRKRDRKHHIARKITLVPAAYFLGSFLVLGGAGDIYTADYYFWGILIAAGIVYAMGYWMICYWGRREKR